MSLVKKLSRKNRNKSRQNRTYISIDQSSPINSKRYEPYERSIQRKKSYFDCRQLELYFSSGDSKAIGIERRKIKADYPYKFDEFKDSNADIF